MLTPEMYKYRQDMIQEVKSLESKILDQVKKIAVEYHLPITVDKLPATIRRLSWTAQNHISPPPNFPFGLECSRTHQERNHLNHKIWAYLLSLFPTIYPMVSTQEDLINLQLVGLKSDMDQITSLERREVLFKYLLGLNHEKENKSYHPLQGADSPNPSGRSRKSRK